MWILEFALACTCTAISIGGGLGAPLDQFLSIVLTHTSFVERVRNNVTMVISFFVGAVVYPFVTHWFVHPGGFLHRLNVVDFGRGTKYTTRSFVELLRVHNTLRFVFSF